MKTLNKLALFIAIIVLVACEKSNDSISNDSVKLIGNWINPVAIDTIWKFEKASSLRNNDYGFSFKSNKLFVERTNAGWCATPPISYADFHGTWEMSDSIININVAYWGGLSNYQWKIISIDNRNLIIYRLKEEPISGY
jgi:hypothetical protein